MPNVRWVLLGDDGGHDPRVFVDFGYRRRDRVVGLRQVFDVDPREDQLSSRVRGAVGAAVVGAPNGEELLPLVRAALGIGQPREGSVADWFLSGFERGNGATRLRAWTEGNAVRSLVDGRTYYKALARALAAAGDGDSVQFVGWRGMPMSSSPRVGRRFSVSRAEQRTRFTIRVIDPLRQWKLSPVDLAALNRWDDYTRAKEEMFRRTDTPWAPWTVVRSNDKRRCRIAALRWVLSTLDYPEQGPGGRGEAGPAHRRPTGPGLRAERTILVKTS